MQVQRITNPSLRSEECLRKELGRKTGAREWDRGCAHVKPLSKSDEGTSVLLVRIAGGWRVGERGWSSGRRSGQGPHPGGPYELYEGVWTLP